MSDGGPEDLTETASGACSVSELAHVIRRALADLGEGWVEGEIQKRNDHRQSGHCYLTLADEEAVVDCAIWKWQRKGMRIPPEGTLVRAHYRRIDFYPPQGRVTLHLDRIEPAGEGELLRRREETLARLREAGLTDPQRKPALPRYPRRIGIVAAPGSDALADVVKAIAERWPAVELVVRPALVQGVRAARSMIDALAHLQDEDAVDVVILARGGGSVGDLAPFDDERLARAIFACAVPVVTAVGHTKNLPVCNFTAAAHADVPGKVAALVVPSAADAIADVTRLSATALRQSSDGVARHAESVVAVADRAQPLRDIARLRSARQERASRLEARAEIRLSAAGRHLAAAHRALVAARRAIPSTEGLETLLRAAGRATLVRAHARRIDVERVGSGAATARSRIPGPGVAADLAARLDRAVARQGAALRTSYARALDRLSDQASRSARRAIIADRRELDVEDRRSAAVCGRFALLRRGVADRGALVAAHDFRGRGWALVTGAGGDRVTSIEGIRVGDPLEVRFADGGVLAEVKRLLAEGASRGDRSAGGRKEPGRKEPG